MKRLFKFISYSSILLSFSILLGRNHLILGTFLIMFRWPIIILLSFLFIIAYKKKLSSLKNYLLIPLVLILLESSYVMIRTTNFNYKTKTNQPKKLSILDYNIYFKNKDKNSSVNLIKSKNADLVLLQEVTPEWNTKLNNNLNYKYSLKHARNGTHGISMYSKYPIKLIKYINNSFGLPIAQIVELTYFDRKILVINTHLASPAKAVENPDKFLRYYFENYSLRQQQFEGIENFVKNIEANYSEIFFIGDLNTTEYEPLFRDIKYHWKNSSTNFLLKSFPNSHKTIPLVNLDYILLRKESQVIKFEVLKGGSSDHSAIYSEIEF